jgi:hypothetical protein
MGYHVRSGITPPFPPSYKLPKLLHFFDRGFLVRGTNPIVIKQNKTKQKISVMLKDPWILPPSVVTKTKM